MYKTDVFISAEEIKEIVGISKSKAYSLIQELNAELKEKGYLTVTGRVSRKYFEERFYGLIKNLSRSRKPLWRNSTRSLQQLFLILQKNPQKRQSRP